MLDRFFKLSQHGTSLRQEAIAGVTTFMTIMYIIIVNPKILEAAGIPFGPSVVVTILSAFLGTLAMGLYANRPFAVAPYMGENAFIAYTVVGILGYTWETALGAIFIGGVLFALISAFRLRAWLAASIPESLKIGFAIGIGLFIAFIGLNETRIVVLGSEGAPVHVGNLTETSVILGIVGFLLIAFLMLRRVKSAILLGILSVTFLAFVFDVAELPEQWVSMPPSILPIFAKLDIAGAFQWGCFSVILTVFVMDFVDTTGTLLGLSYRAGLLDKHGNLPQIERPMLCDSLATVVAAVLGTTTTGTYIESATGIEAGGRTGLTSVVTAFMFLLALFLAPFFAAVPACAYGPALIIVGMLMLAPITRVKFDDLTEVVPIFSIMVLMSFTYNIGIGMTAGFIVYPFMKLCAGRVREVSTGLWILTALSLAFFVFYPY